MGGFKVDRDSSNVKLSDLPKVLDVDTLASKKIGTLPIIKNDTAATSSNLKLSAIIESNSTNKSKTVSGNKKAPTQKSKQSTDVNVSPKAPQKSQASKKGSDATFLNKLQAMQNGDMEAWREYALQEVDEASSSELSPKKKEAWKKFINRVYDFDQKKFMGMTYSEAKNTYDSIRAKYSKYVYVMVPDGQMQVGVSEDGRPKYGATKLKIDEGRLLEIIREYGSQAELNNYVAAKAALEQFDAYCKEDKG